MRGRTFSYGGLIFQSNWDIGDVYPPGEPWTGAPIALNLDPRPPPPRTGPLHRWTGRYGLALERCGQDWLLRARWVGCAVITTGAGVARLHPLPGTSEAALSGFVLSCVLPWIAMMRGRLALHAAACAHQDRCLVFIGPPRAGKSVLSAALSHHGDWRLLSDDAVFIDPETCVIWPGAAGLSLRQSNPLALTAPRPIDRARAFALAGMIFLDRREGQIVPGLSPLSPAQAWEALRPGLPYSDPTDPDLVKMMDRRWKALLPGLSHHRLIYPPGAEAFAPIARRLGEIVGASTENEPPRCMVVDKTAICTTD